MKKYKAGQLVTIFNKVYRIKKAPALCRQVCSLCDMKDNDFREGCFRHCYRRMSSGMPMKHYYEQVNKSLK